MKTCFMSKIITSLFVAIYTLLLQPTPASRHLNNIINSKDAKEKIVVQVVDQYGRAIERRANLTRGSAVR